MASLLLGYGSGFIDFNSAVSIQNCTPFTFKMTFASLPVDLNLGLRWE
jgi:hypothetical protein